MGMVLKQITAGAAIVLATAGLVSVRLLAEATPAHAATAFAAVKDIFMPELKATAKDLGVPFDRYEITDSLNRPITFYVTPAPEPKAGEAAKPLPLAVFVQGSGGNSLFSKTADGRVGGGLQSMIARDYRGKVRVMSVEKPGVRFLDRPKMDGTAEGTSAEFRREHTPERWTEAISASIDAALKLPGVDPSKVLVVGHSEGGTMAAHVAAANLKVTDVAVLSAGGCSQLFDMAQLARESRGGEPAEASEARVEEVYQTWGRIVKDPENIDAMEWGHPRKRWASFLSTSALDGLRQTPARVFLAYGTADRAVPVESCDVLRAELVRLGRDVTVDRRVGEDHGFAAAGGQPKFEEVFGEVMRWWGVEKS